MVETQLCLTGKRVVIEDEGEGAEDIVFDSNRSTGATPTHTCLRRFHLLRMPTQW